MKHIIFTISFVLITYSLMQPIRADDGNMKQGYQGSKAAEEVDLDAAMAECNKSFIIDMAYTDALNKSGSFPDETDLTPKCFVRCVMENTGSMSSDGVFDLERVAIIFAAARTGIIMADVKDIALMCADRNETCKCEKAYSFMKCLMTKEIEKYEKKV